MEKKNAQKDIQKMKKNSRIFVAGHRGLVGSAIVRALKKEGYTSIITHTRDQLDLLDMHAVANFFKKQKIDYVFDAAAKVGGIMGNHTYPADFIYQNLQIQNNIIHNAFVYKVKKLLFLGSSCIYPKFADQPIREEALMTGVLEPTNRAYAVAKIAGIEMVNSYNRQYGTDFISAMPTNLYGPFDNFDLHNSHVIPALIRKFHEAKVNKKPFVDMWGTGSAKREFLHVDDLAKASIFLMNNYSGSEHINVGTGEDVSIKELTEIIQEVIGYEGELKWDTTKPDGTPRKLLNIDRIKSLGWEPKIPFKEGVASAYEWFKNEWIPKNEKTTKGTISGTRPVKKTVKKIKKR